MKIIGQWLLILLIAGIFRAGGAFWGSIIVWSPLVLVLLVMLLKATVFYKEPTEKEIPNEIHP